MKPLNRPMFRYGGPIKEGIMSGMKDRPGYSAAGRVGGFLLNQIPKIKNFFKSQPSICLLYTSPSPRDVEESRMPSSA